MMESARSTFYRSPPFTSFERLKQRLTWRDRNPDFEKLHEALQAPFRKSELSLNSKRSSSLQKKKQDTLGVTSVRPLKEILEQEIHKDIARSVHLESLNFRRVRSSSRIDTIHSLMQQRNLENEKEQVAKLDSWQLATQGCKQQYGSRVLQQAEELAKTNMTEIVKEQARDRKMIKRNSEILGKLSPLNKPFKKISSSQKKIKPNFPNQIFSDNMDYEGKALFQYNFLQEKVSSKKAILRTALKEKSQILEEIYKLKDSIKINKMLLQRDNIVDSIDPKIQNSKISPAPPVDPIQRNMNFQLREKRKVEIKNSREQIETLRKDLQEVDNKIKKNNSKLESIKFQVVALREELSQYYHTLLSAGVDTRQEGLIWIIKAIWRIEKSVNISQIPAYIDEKGIEYLFAYARKEIRMLQLKQALRPSRATPGLIPSFSPSTSFPLEKKVEIEREIKSIHKELQEMKEREYCRIQREFTLKQYKILFNVSLLTVINALFGNEFVSKEMERSPQKQSTILF